MMNYSEAARAILYWQHGGDSFTCKLFELWMKADSKNRAKLRATFDAEIQAIQDWDNSPTPEEFYQQNGILP